MACLAWPEYPSAITRSHPLNIKPSFRPEDGSAEQDHITAEASCPTGYAAAI